MIEEEMFLDFSVDNTVRSDNLFYFKCTRLYSYAQEKLFF